MRAVPRRGRLRRRLRRRRAEPRVPGDPAAARQDHQRREGAHHKVLSNQEIQSIIMAIGASIGEDFDLASRALPQDRRDDGRGRRRRAHPHADPDVLLPPHARSDRRRLRLHRAAAAVSHQDRPQRALREERRRAREAAARPRSSRRSRSPIATASRAGASPRRATRASPARCASTTAGPHACAPSSARPPSTTSRTTG